MLAVMAAKNLAYRASGGLTARERGHLKRLVRLHGGRRAEHSLKYAYGRECRYICLGTYVQVGQELGAFITHYPNAAWASRGGL